MLGPPCAIATADLAAPFTKMPPGQRKLRDSCDSCHIAKVKCIKTSTGECLRCTSSSAVCSFSPSDRRGKPRGAKNKCNRVPQPQVGATPQAAPVKSSPAPCAPVTAGPDEAYPSPAYEFDKYFNNTTQAGFAAAEAAWALPTPDDGVQPFDLTPSDESLASMVHADWMNLDGGSIMHDGSPLQQHTPRTSVSSTYPEPTLTSPHPFPMLQMQQQHQQQHQQQQHQSLAESGIFDSLASPSSGQTNCKCYPINLQSLYTLHCQQINASSGGATPFDVALFINNKAIERCHSMLSCKECVLNPDKEKSSTNMLMLAGAMDDILMSYGTTCTAYLDGTSQDPLVFSSSDSVGTSSSSTSSTPPHIDDAEFITRAHSTSSASSSTASGKSRTIFSPATQLSLGTYRVEGEDGYHLKLEILKIELRKVERLWIAFRDTCAMQKFEDEQKSLYAALVCYLAKKLRRTAEMLEARRRVSASGW